MTNVERSNSHKMFSTFLHLILYNSFNKYRLFLSIHGISHRQEIAFMDCGIALLRPDFT